jgi:hypothetical protein
MINSGEWGLLCLFLLRATRWALAELAWHADPEGRARQAVAQARQQAERAALEEAAEANLARWESELTALLVKLRISRGHISK